MNYFDVDPIKTYRALKLRIPSIKIKNKNFMNKLHNLDKSSDFWWAISGEYAILAEHTMILLAEDPRILHDLHDQISARSEALPPKILTHSLINLIGRDCFFDKGFTLNKKEVLKKNINELLADDLEKNIIMDVKISKFEKPLISMIYLTNFLTFLRLEKLKFLYLKIKEKIKNIFYHNNNFEDKIIYSDSVNKDFELVQHLLLPNNLKEYFPKWFLWLSNYLVKSKHKWKTYYGENRDIYQKILNAKSYEKYGSKNITIISHGCLISHNTWWLHCLSLFPDTKCNITVEDLPKISKKKLPQDILFCGTPFPYVSQFFSIQHFWDFMEVYKRALKLINNGLKNGKKIRIKYKDFRYLTGLTVPYTPNECKIPIEKESFENVYGKYKLIVSMPFGAISLKCHKNNIKCISYNYPYVLTDKKSYLKINEYPGVYKSANKFLHELEKQIKKL